VNDHPRTFVTLGAAAAFVGVAAGSFGAHALKGYLDAAALATWQTAVLYNLVHALGTIAVGLCRPAPEGERALRRAGWCFMAGIVLFSGSLYLLALTQLRPLAYLTPLGGLAFLAGWVLLAIAARR
jgi:uncharacterized membrane protein YgdD (TMEM256/DUF423 family)